MIRFNQRTFVQAQYDIEFIGNHINEFGIYPYDEDWNINTDMMSYSDPTYKYRKLIGLLLW